MKQHLQPVVNGVALLLVAAMLGSTFATSTAFARPSAPAGPTMDEIREQMCTEIIEARPKEKFSLTPSTQSSARKKSKTVSPDPVIEVADYRKIFPFNLDAHNPNKIIDNTPDDKKYLSRLILQYRMLWNSYFFRNEGQWSAKDAKRRVVVSRMMLSREPCLTSEHSVAYVKAFIRYQSEDLLWLLDREINSSPSPEKALANRQFVTDVLYKEMEKPTLHKLSVKAFNRLSAKMVALPPEPAPVVPVDSNGQPLYITVTPSSSTSGAGNGNTVQ